MKPKSGYVWFTLVILELFPAFAVYEREGRAELLAQEGLIV